MTQLAVWSIDGLDAGEAPQRLGRAGLGLEKHFEDWIAKDATLIAEGLTLVGRQVHIDDGRLDLLGIDSQDRWVVIELKSGTVNASTLAQALYYASSIARLDVDELREKLEPRLCELGDAAALSARVKQQLAGEAEGREIAVMVVGAGIHPGLERVSEFLGRFGVPISIVSFEVFELNGGPQLLIREVVDEPATPTEPSIPRHKLSEDAIRRWAYDVGVGGQFDRFVNMAREAGLAVQPQRASVRVAPPADRRRFLMYARPHDTDASLLIYVGPKQFAEFFSNVDETESENALHDVGGVYLGGAYLDKQLGRIEKFLKDKFPQPDADGG